MVEDLYYDDYPEATAELTKAIQRGRLPLLAQELNAYDCVQAIFELDAVNNPEDEEDAFFDLALALIGWVPGPGQELKIILRLINRAPQRHAERLFDLIRHTLQACRLKTSPEQLLEKCLDPRHLSEEMPEIVSAVRSASTFNGLTPQQQQLVIHNLDEAREHSEFLMESVRNRIAPWIAVQRNNSAAAHSCGPALLAKPQSSLEPGKVPARSALPGETRDAARTTQAINQGLEPLAGEGHWLELNLHYPNLEPVSGAAYRVIFSDGSQAEGSLDEEGFARLEGIPPGPAKLYYGEDPRPYQRLPIRALANDPRQLAEELAELELEPADVDLPILLLEASQRKALFTLIPVY
ncbi:hypothetical protein RBU55_14320 [Pseudomonas chlororaphis subsp. aurantiaca]|uniref:hypothetical protein n=1 Tax=Pseudomonas chlororaphis TaxID=587753 RepID=UPI0027DAC129|nr:hypothetical protein [Pseudomonas chlororaphis]WMJ02691.1 hypothetical protein RBU55_14320 [Pseudomonas chlororaphis subsp. aurantiaca]